MSGKRAPRRDAKPRAKAPADMPRVPQKRGGALLAGGVKGNKGGYSLPAQFRDTMRRLASAPAQLTHLRTVLKNPDHPHFIAARRYVTEYGYGKPVQQVQHTGAEGGEIRVLVRRET